LHDLNKTSFAKAIERVGQDHQERKRSRREERRPSRPLDGDKSGASTPALSRIGSSIWGSGGSSQNLSRNSSSLFRSGTSSSSSSNLSHNSSSFFRSGTSSPNLSRTNSFFRLGTSSPSLSRINSTNIPSPLSGLKRADTGSAGSDSINSNQSRRSSVQSRISSLRSIHSISSSGLSSFRSNNSPNTSGLSRVSSFLSRTPSVPLSEDDRELQGHETWQEQRVRRSEPGADSKSDTAPHEGQGQRRFFGIHASKSAV
jgi:hypothetical protein